VSDGCETRQDNRSSLEAHCTHIKHVCWEFAIHGTVQGVVMVAFHSLYYRTRANWL
jgi:hypothetical protein